MWCNIPVMIYIFQLMTKMRPWSWRRPWNLTFPSWGLFFSIIPPPPFEGFRQKEIKYSWHCIKLRAKNPRTKCVKFDTILLNFIFIVNQQRKNILTFFSNCWVHLVLVAVGWMRWQHQARTFQLNNINQNLSITCCAALRCWHKGLNSLQNFVKFSRNVESN